MCFWAPFLPVNRSPSFWTPFCLSSQPFVFNSYYLKSWSLPAPPGREKKSNNNWPPPLRRKKVIIIQQPPAPLTGSGSYFCLSSRFRDLVLPLISSTAAFFVSWNAFSAATKCVSGRLFCQWIGLRASGRRFVFLHSRLCSILIIWNHNRCPPPRQLQNASF